MATSRKSRRHGGGAERAPTDTPTTSAMLPHMLPGRVRLLTTSLVLAAAAGGVSGTTIAAQLVRFDGGSGAVAISNGLPLKPGALTAAQLTGVHVYVGGAEVPIGVQALAGTPYADGTLRGVRLQLDATIPDALPVAATVVLNTTPRALPDLAPRAVTGAPTAALLPVSRTYLMAALRGVLGPLLPPDPAASSDVQQVEALFRDVVPTQTKYEVDGTGLNVDDGADYDRQLGFFQEWARTGDPVWWSRAVRKTGAYIRDALPFIRPNGTDLAPYAQAEWNANTGSFAPYYYGTGDPAALVAARCCALRWGDTCNRVYPVGLDGNGQNIGEWRIQARWFEAARTAKLLGVLDADPAGLTLPPPQAGATDWSFFVPRCSSAVYAANITTLLGNDAQTPGRLPGSSYFAVSSPGVPVTPPVYGQKNYEVGMVVSEAIWYQELFAPADARILPFVQRCADYVFTTQWVPAGQGYNYVSVDHYGSGGGYGNDGGTGVQGGFTSLNGGIGPTFLAGWLYHKTGQSQYATYFDRHFAGFLATGNKTGRGIDEFYRNLFVAMAWRAQGATA